MRSPSHWRPALLLSRCHISTEMAKERRSLGFSYKAEKLTLWAHPLMVPPGPTENTQELKKKKTIIKILASVSFFLSNLLQVLHLFICSTGFSFFHEPSQTQIFIRCPSSSQPSSIFAFRRMESTSSSQVDSVYKLGASNFPPKVHTLTWRNGAKGHLISSPLHLFCASTALMQHRKQGWACEALVGLRWWCLHRVAGEDWHICEGENAAYVSPSENSQATAFLSLGYDTSKHLPSTQVTISVHMAWNPTAFPGICSASGLRSTLISRVRLSSRTPGHFFQSGFSLGIQAASS